MSFVNVKRLQKRQKAPTNTNSGGELLAPFPTIPPILDPSKINNNPSLENTVVDNSDDGVSDTEMFGLIGGALVVIGLIGIFIKKKIGGNSKKYSDKERSAAAYKSHSSQNLIDDLNEQGKNSPIMMEHQFNSSSPRMYDSPLTPRSDSSDSQFGPPYVNKNLPHSKQDDLYYSPNSYSGPSPDDDSLHLIHAPNFQQKDPSYPSDSYKRSSPDGYSSPYLPKSSFPPNTPNTLNTPITPITPNTPPYPQDDYPSPFLPRSPPFTHNIPNTPNTSSYSSNSYGGSQNSQSYRTSQHFQQQYSIDPTQGTLLPPKSSYQPQQYISSPNSPHSLEDSPRSPSFSKSEPVSTNDQNSSSSISYQDTPLVPTVDNNIISNDKSENFSVNSEITNNEIKEIDDMIANIIQSDNMPPSLPKTFSRISDSSFAGLFSNMPTDEKSNQPNSQTSSIYSVQPTQGMSQIKIASENNIPPSNLNHDHDLPQSAAMGYIEPTQSNMVIEHVNEPSGTSEVQFNKTQPITTGFIQPSQSNMKIEKVDSDVTFRPEISASNMTGVEIQTGPKPLYDIAGIKKHAEMILNAKTEKKSDLNNESNFEKVTENNETQNNEMNDGKQGEPLVRKKSVRFRTESNEEETKVSNPKKSILINKSDVINVQSSTPKSENSRDEKENHRDSNSGSYDFDISGYQDESYLT